VFPVSQLDAGKAGATLSIHPTVAAEPGLAANRFAGLQPSFLRSRTLLSAQDKNNLQMNVGKG
jgi:hypothetical protein